MTETQTTDQEAMSRAACNVLLRRLDPVSAASIASGRHTAKNIERQREQMAEIKAWAMGQTDPVRRAYSEWLVYFERGCREAEREMHKVAARNQALKTIPVPPMLPR